MIAIDYSVHDLRAAGLNAPAALVSRHSTAKGVEYEGELIIAHIMRTNPKIQPKLGSTSYTSNSGRLHKDAPEGQAIATMEGNFSRWNHQWSVTWYRDHAEARIYGDIQLDLTPWERLAQVINKAVSAIRKANAS